MSGMFTPSKLQEIFNDLVGLEITINTTVGGN